MAAGIGCSRIAGDIVGIAVAVVEAARRDSGRWEPEAEERRFGERSEQLEQPELAGRFEQAEADRPARAAFEEQSALVAAAPAAARVAVWVLQR